MPIREKITAFDAENFDPATFDAKAFKQELLAEFDHDETAWRAAVTQRDTTIADTTTKLTAAQAKAWELLQQVPAGQNAEAQGQKPDDPTDVGFDDIFTTEERK